MDKERHAITLSDSAYKLVNDFAMQTGQPPDLAADQLIAEGAGYRLLAEAKTKGIEKPYVAAVAKQSR